MSATYYPSVKYLPRQYLTENSSILIILVLRVRPDDCAEVEVVNRLLVLHHPVAPLLLAGLALHVILDEVRRGVEVGEFFLEVCVDLVVHLGQAELRAGDLFEDGPVCHEVFDGCSGVSWNSRISVIGNGEGPTLDRELLLHLYRKRLLVSLRRCRMLRDDSHPPGSAPALDQMASTFWLMCV